MALEDNDGAPPSASSGGKASRRRKRNRWGGAAGGAASSPDGTSPKNNSGGSSSVSANAGGTASSVVVDPKAKLKAMQESIQARLAAAKAAKAKAGIAAPTSNNKTAAVAPGARVSALQESIKARLAAAKAKQQHIVSGSGLSSLERPAKRAKQFDLDMSVTAPTYKTKPTTATQAESGPPEPPPPPSNPYLAHTAPHPPLQGEEDGDDAVDLRLASRKQKSHKHRELKFVQPGKWQEIAERKREKAAQLEESGFLSGRKAGHSIQSTQMGTEEATTYGPSLGSGSTESILPPRWDAHTDTTMPLTLEWWDVELLPSKLKKQVARAEAAALSQQSKAALTQNLKEPPGESNKMEDSKPPVKGEQVDDESGDALSKLRESCFDNCALFHCKTADLIQHIVPIESIAKQDAPQPVLHLTKAELKRRRKLRRQNKQRELQDLQAAGLIPAPEPRLTLQNFIKVLGDQAFLDPSKHEQKVVAQIQARQEAHLQRNQEKKLTKEQRAAKVDSKLQSQVDSAVAKAQVHVALFFVKNASHPYHRAKLDLNARQWKITGGVLECPAVSTCCVIAEGSSQAISKYIRLLTVRMNWTTGPDGGEIEDDVGEGKEGDVESAVRHKFDPTNRCELVWQGMVTKRNYNHFSFQAGETPDQCRKILKQKGQAIYWDQVMQISGNIDSSLGLKLAYSDDDDEEEEEEQEPTVDADGNAPMAED